jgi:hypothetical protein
MGIIEKNHLMNAFNGFSEVGSLKSSSEHWFEKLMIIDAAVEVVTFYFETLSIKIGTF